MEGLQSIHEFNKRIISLCAYSACLVFQKGSPGAWEDIQRVTQTYVMHLWFIFGISAIYSEAAHKQDSSCAMQPLHHTRNTSLCFCLTCRPTGGTNLIQLHFHNLQFTVKHCAFLVLPRKSDWMNLGRQLHIVQNPGSATEENQWGEALISLQSANAVSSETLCPGFCYSSHSVAHVFNPSSYHAAALWIQFHSSYTFIKTVSSRRKKKSAYAQFSFHVCSRLNEIAFTSVTFHCVTMSLGRENFWEGETMNHQENSSFSHDEFDVHLGCLANLFSFFLWKK